MNVWEYLRMHADEGPNWMGTEPLSGDDVREILGTVERLHAALKRYGQHDLTCPVSAGADRKHCSCGLDAFEQSAAPINPDEGLPTADDVRGILKGYCEYRQIGKACGYETCTGCAICDMAAEIEQLRALLKHADDVVIWEHTPARSGFQEEIEAALGIRANDGFEARYQEQQAEIERLQNELVDWKRQAGKYTAGCELCEERERENERLRAALKDIADDPGGYPAEDAFEAVREIARAVLEQNVKAMDNRDPLEKSIDRAARAALVKQRDEARAEIKRLTRERKRIADICENWANNNAVEGHESMGLIQDILDTPEQSAPECPNHPTGRMVDDAGNRICSSCGRSS